MTVGVFFVGTSQKVSTKHVLIMDEIDGMAGNEDRGGIQVKPAAHFSGSRTRFRSV